MGESRIRSRTVAWTNSTLKTPMLSIGIPIFFLSVRLLSCRPLACIRALRASRARASCTFSSTSFPFFTRSGFSAGRTTAAASLQRCVRQRLTTRPGTFNDSDIARPLRYSQCTPPSAAAFRPPSRLARRRRTDLLQRRASRLQGPPVRFTANLRRS